MALAFSRPADFSWRAPPSAILFGFAVKIGGAYPRECGRLRPAAVAAALGCGAVAEFSAIFGLFLERRAALPRRQPTLYASSVIALGLRSIRTGAPIGIGSSFVAQTCRIIFEQKLSLLWLPPIGGGGISQVIFW